MESVLEIEKKDNILFIKATGTYNRVEFRSFPELMLDICNKECITKIIFDAIELKGTDISQIDRFIMGKEIARYLGFKIKLAVVWPEKDINKFTETVVINRGGLIRVFGDIENAENWLLSK